jgi:peptidyl-prolyl cis-trans isomerase C
MKFAIVLLSSALLAQAQDPVTATPGTPAVKGPPAQAPPAVAATPPPPVAPDTVVVEVNGKKYTASQVDKLIEALPPQYQQAARSQPKLLSQVFLMQHLADDAQKAGLDQQSPYKEQLEISRMQVLSTAALSNYSNTLQVPDAEQQKYYKDNPDKFKEVKVKVIFVAFNPAPGKPTAEGRKLPSEAEALAKIEDLAKQIKASGDFGKLARENSDDQTSAAKDGDFGIIKQDGSYPQNVKVAVFALKQGELSAPIKEPNGFYLIRAEEINEAPFQESIVQIIQLVRQAHYQDWMKGMQDQYSVKVENPAYFTPRLPAQLQQVH